LAAIAWRIAHRDLQPARQDRQDRQSSLLLLLLKKKKERKSARRSVAPSIRSVIDSRILYFPTFVDEMIKSRDARILGGSLAEFARVAREICRDIRVRQVLADVHFRSCNL
jgi:hypothetical protein